MATPSEFIGAYRERFPDDPRTDAELISALGVDPTPRPGAPEPKDVTAFAPPPSFGRSARLGLESGIYGLGSTLSSAGALAAEWVPGTFADPVRNSLLQTAQEQEQRASELATQAPVTDISNVSTGSDFINWAAFGLGQVAPTMAETLTTAAIGGLAGAGATAETGPGAAVGGLGGVILGAIERRAVKSLISKGVKELSEDLVRKEMRNIAGRWGVRAASGVNSWALSSGELYGDLLKNGNISPDDARNYSTGLGAIAAIPDTFLPEYLWGRFFDRDVLVNPVSKEEAKEAGNFLLKFLLNTSAEAAKAGAVEGSTEGFQEWINIAADHWADPKSARGGFEVSSEEWNRIKNAAAIGALAGASTAPATGYVDTRRAMSRPVTPEVEAELAPAPAAPAPVAPEAALVPPPPVVETPVAPPVVAAPPPVVETPAPVVEAPTETFAPAPAVEPPAPVVETPAPVVEAPVPVVTPPTLVAETPAPVVEAPTPVAAETSAPAPEAKKIGSITEWHPLAEAPSTGTLKAYGTEIGISKEEAVGKPALTRMTVVTENPDGTISVNGVYGIPGAKANVRVHTGGTTGRAVTAQMVADHLGISVSTARAAVRADSKIAAETKAKVREAYATLGATTKQNPEIGSFVEGKNVLGFLKVGDASEDLQLSYPDRAAFDADLSTLSGDKIKRQQAKIKEKEARREGISGERAIARLRMLGQKGANAAALLDHLSEYVASLSGATKEESLHGLLSTKFLNDPFVVDAEHLSRAFAVLGERAVGHEEATSAGKKLAGIFSKGDLEAALDAEPTSLPTHVEAAVAGTFGNNASGVKSWAAKRAEMGKRKLGRPVSEISLDVIGDRGELRGEDAADETLSPVSTEEATVSRTEEVESSFGFERPTPVDELDNTSDASLMHTTDDELSLAYQAFDLTDGKLVNIRDENAVLDYIEEFRSKLQGLSRQKQYAKLGLFQNNKLTDDAYVSGLIRDILTKKVLRTRAVPSVYRVTPTFVKTAFNNLVHFLGNQGIDVRLINGVVDTASEMLVNEQAKIALDKETGRTVVTLALNDLSKPTLHNLRALMHETAHAIVRSLPMWQQRAFHDAIWSAFNEGALLRASNDPRLSSWTMAERAGLTKEEFLEELLVEHLTALGIDRAQSKSLIGDFFRFIRRIFTVAAERLMNAKGYTTESPDKMLSFVEREFTAVIDRATAPRTDILEFLGVSRRSPGAKTIYFTTSNGDTVAQIYNPATGELSSNKIVLDSPAAVQANVEQIVDQLFHIPNSEIATTVTDQSKFEAGIVDNVPGKKLLPNQWLVTVFNYGDGIPVAVQIDSIENGKNIFSASPEALREQGYFVPDFKALPTGQYTVEEASGAVSTARTYQSADAFRTPKLMTELAQIKEVRSPEGKLLAPNGEPSKLSAYRWKLVRTPSFKAWFGDWENAPATASKIVDAVTGEPLVVYHGAPEMFTEFKKEKLGKHTGAASATQGFFFVDNYKVAEGYSRAARAAREGGGGKMIFTGTAPTKETLNLAADRIGKWVLENPEFSLTKNPFTEEYLETDLDRYRAIALRSTIADWARFADKPGLSPKDRIVKYLNSGGSNPDINTLLSLLYGSDASAYSYMIEEEKASESPELAIPLFLNVRDPGTYDYKGEEYREKKFFNVLRDAKQDGKDGAALYNTHDVADTPIIGWTEPEKLKVEESPKGWWVARTDNVMADSKFHANIAELGNGKFRLETPSGTVSTYDSLERAVKEAQLTYENTFSPKPIYDIPPAHNVFVAFEPTQIKSASGNTGEFSNTNPDILRTRQVLRDKFRVLRTLEDGTNEVVSEHDTLRQARIAASKELDLFAELDQIEGFDGSDPSPKLSADLENIAAGITDIVSRVTGGRSRLFFVKDLSIPVEYADKSTKDLQLNGMSVGDIIAMNTTAMAIESGNGDLLTPLSTASHESWHFLDTNGFLSDEERTLLRKSRKELENILTKLRGSEFNWSTMGDDELQAFAFQEYTRAVMEGRPGDFPNVDTRTVFDKVYQFFKELAKLLKGLGYNNVEDFTVKNIFYKAWTGEMASRIPQKSREVLFASASEPKRKGTPLVSDRVKFDMEVLSATINTLDVKIKELYAPILRGMTLEDYFTKILRLPKSVIPTVDMQATLDEQSKLHGLEGLYRKGLSLMGTGESEITNPVMRTQVQNEVYRALHSLEMKVRKAGIEEAVAVEKGIATNVRKKEDFLKRLGNYENSSTILNPLVTELIRLTRHLRQDLTNGESKRPVTEAWRELLGYDTADKQFTAADLPAMTAAVGSLSSNDGQTLLTYVTEMAKLGLDYDANPSASRDKIRAANNAALNDLVDGTPVGSAKLAILTTLAKFDPALFGLARLRVEKNPSDKLGLAKLLNEALAGGNTKWSLLLSSKRELIGAPKYSKYVLHAVNLTRKKLISEFNSLTKRRGNKDQFEIAARALQKYKSELESDAGFSLADGPILQGTEIFHITDPNANRDAVLASRVPAGITGESARTGMAKIWMDNLRWLNAFTGPKDALYLAVKRQTEKLGTMLTDRTQRQGKKWWGTQFIQSISDRLLDTGSPTARDLGRMLHRYADLLFSNEENVQRYGRLFNTAYANAAKAFGLIGNSEEFRQLFLNPAYAFIESRPDITDKNRLYVELKAYLLASSPSAEKLLRTVPGSFDKLTACIEANSAAWSHLRKLADQWGVLVEDSALKVYNPLTGKEESILRPGISVATFMAPRSVRKIAAVVETIRNLWSRDDSFGMKYIEDRYLGRDVFKNKAFQNTLSKLDDAGKRELIAKLQRFLSTTPAGRAGVQDGLRSYFDDTVIGEFVLPLIKRPEGDVFKAPNGGYTAHSNVLQAWEDSKNDIVNFAENLFALEYEPSETDTEAGVTEARAKYVASVVNTFLGYYKNIESMVQSTESSKEYLGGDSVRHSLIDARRAQLMPQEWVDYAMATPEALHVSLTSLATHASMGRDMTDFNLGVKKVLEQVSEAQKVLNRRRTAIRREAELIGEVLSSKQVEKRVVASFDTQKEYDQLRTMAEQASNIGEIPRQVDTWLHTQANPDTDLRVPLAVTRGVAGLMVNSWRTFLYNANALLSPFMQYKMSKTAVNQFLNNLKYTKQEALGTLLSAVGRQLNETASEREFRESVGMFIDPEVYTSMYGRWANPGAGGNYEADQTGRTVSRIRKTVDTITNFGWGGNARYAKLRPFGALNMGSFWFKRALMQGQLTSVSNLLGKAVGYLEGHPEVIDDPSFRFSASMLGYTSKTGLDEAAAFDGLVASVERSGYPLEVLAREALDRKRRGKEGALLTKTQSQAIMARALDELSLESSVSNTPIWTQTNSFARAAMPLLTWPLVQTNAVLKSFMGADGQTSLRAAKNGTKAMLFAILPLSLAYTLLMDEFDEEVLGRKGNLMPLSLDGGFGPFAGASIERLARMGTFGLAGDLVNGLRVYGTDGDLRGLSFDQRVLFMNSTLTAMRLISTLVQQGPSNLTYESFYRPLLTSLGAGQAIQYTQLANKFGNDWIGVRPFTLEYEALNRLNVRYYLAGAGRLTGLEVRGIKSGGGTTNSVRPWVTRMGVAAMADDRSEFISAYKNAVTEAKRLGEENPEEYVKRSYSYSHPLRSVFQTPPSKGQFVRLLNSMNDTGRDGVLSAIHHYNLYGESLGLKPYTGTEEKEPKTGKREVNPLDVKRRARQALFNSEFFK